jgi:hypothetical protein
LKLQGLELLFPQPPSKVERLKKKNGIGGTGSDGGGAGEEEKEDEEEK